MGTGRWGIKLTSAVLLPQIDDGSGQQQQFPMQGNNTQIPGQWTSEDPNNQNNLQSPYYGSSAYPSVYSNMFSNDGRTSGFMGGSTNIPPMPAPSGPSASNGLQNLALASTSSYYTDYNANQFNVDGTANNIPPPTPAGGEESPSIAAGSDGEKSMGKSTCVQCAGSKSLTRFPVYQSFTVYERTTEVAFAQAVVPPTVQVGPSLVSVGV